MTENQAYSLGVQHGRNRSKYAPSQFQGDVRDAYSEGYDRGVLTAAEQGADHLVPMG